MARFQQSDSIKRLPEQFFAKLVNKIEPYYQAGFDMINLGQGNPDQPTPDHIIKTLQTSATNPVHHKYPPFRGHTFLKKAIADYYKREYDVELDPEKEVAILFGAKAGLVEVSQCLLNHGDTVLVPDPGYPDYESGIAIAGAKQYRMALKRENDFLPDYDSIPEEVLQKAKLMFLNYPNNPTAGIATSEFFEETVRLGEKTGCCIVHDFAYGSIGFDRKKPFSFLQTKGAKEVGVEMYTLSKTYNMAGWRVGFALGNEEVVEAINLIQDHYYCGMFGSIQEAAASALNGPQDCVHELTAIYEDRRNAFISKLKDNGWDVDYPKGSFFSWIPVPEGYTSEDYAELLIEKAHVIVAPGNGFGKTGEGFVRVGLNCEKHRLLEAADRMINVHSKHL
ncbi:pyridoxal phosphate-dependent aminotransferase [Pseudalkalibacillus salsuginis]|uniref:pyridoxal phosphate-dependent aminotransferase n=1 Tax=Pseudalkalibacillus salsuginis TaxID=2910972 RepID=UPI001F43C5FE|nr:pyridoxal phosphate-dependent aminotransferase [Pseudalkalibacillus salsuginis]MCF6409259.1 pyridoxal phosphate-dependent aminotransferase [Pseudalkalibacillus salsuginis]